MQTLVSQSHPYVEKNFTISLVQRTKNTVARPNWDQDYDVVATLIGAKIFFVSISTILAVVLL